LTLNIKGAGPLTVWTPLAVFLAFAALWCGEIFWRFRRVPRDVAV
jgi:hypothetical protein